MAALLTLYIEGDALHSYDGTDYAVTNIDKTLVSASKPYADALTWATNAATALITPHTAVAIMSGNIDDTIVNTPAANFEGYHDVSRSGLLALLQGAINKVVADSNKNGFKLFQGRMRYFCPVCDNVHVAPHSTVSNQGSSPIMEFVEESTGETHRSPQNKAVLYSMHKHLTTPYA